MAGLKEILREEMAAAQQRIEERLSRLLGLPVARPAAPKAPKPRATPKPKPSRAKPGAQRRLSSDEAMQMQSRALEQFVPGSYLRAGQVAELLELPSSDRHRVTNALNALVTKKLLKREGARRSAKYTLAVAKIDDVVAAQKGMSSSGSKGTKARGASK